MYLNYSYRVDLVENFDWVLRRAYRPTGGFNLDCLLIKMYTNPWSLIKWLKKNYKEIVTIFSVSVLKLYFLSLSND